MKDRRKKTTTSEPLPQDRYVSFSLQYRTCGKKTCRTCRDKPGHGPYWYAYWREDGRLRSRYLGKDFSR